MKKLYLGLLLMVAVVSCTNNKPAKTESETQASVEDSAKNNADTIGIDSTETTPPPAVDELFADFIYSYTTNRSFQFRRTDFPLRKYENGKFAGTVDRIDWKFEKLYYKHSLHIIILDGEKDLNNLILLRPDTVRVEWLQFSKKKCKQYVFARENGCWRMNRINYSSIDKHPDADFLKFYERFAADSVFQSEHLNEMIDFITFDEDNHYNKIEGIIESDQWPAFHPELPAYDIFNIDYGLKLKNQNVRVVSVRGNSNGMSSMFKFVRHKGSWKLVKFEN